MITYPKDKRLQAVLLNFVPLSSGPVFSSLSRTWTRKSSRSMDLEHHATSASKDTGESKTRFLNDNLCLLEVQNVAVRPYKPHFQCIFPLGARGILNAELTV